MRGPVDVGDALLGAGWGAHSARSRACPWGQPARLTRSVSSATQAPSRTSSWASYAGVWFEHRGAKISGFVVLAVSAMLAVTTTPGRVDECARRCIAAHGRCLQVRR